MDLDVPTFVFEALFLTINRRFGRQDFGVVLIQNMLSVLLLSGLLLHKSLFWLMKALAPSVEG